MCQQRVIFRYAILTLQIFHIVTEFSFSFLVTKGGDKNSVEGCFLA